MQVHLTTSCRDMPWHVPTGTGGLVGVRAGKIGADNNRWDAQIWAGEELRERACDLRLDAAALVVAWGEVVKGLVGPGRLVGHVLICLGG